LIRINGDSDEHRISFLVKRHLGNIINFDDSPVLLVNVDQILLEGRSAIQPPNITCTKRGLRRKMMKNSNKLAKCKIIPTPIEIPAVEES
jgi:hypothetical protein